MIDLEVIHLNKYTRRETADYLTDSTSVLFAISGFEYIEINGRHIGSVPSHFIYLLGRDSKVRFRCNSNRLNWALLFNTHQIRNSNDPTQIMIRHADGWVNVNALTAVSEEHVSGWEGEFVRMHQAFIRPTALAQLRVKIGIMNILRYIIDAGPDTLKTTPAGKLKSMIDEGLAHDKTLEMLSRSCKYSADHLRVLFKQEFGVTPLEYYNRSRMSTAISLIDNSDLNISEIAERCGYKHLSHFCEAFKKSFAMTPSEAVKKLRHF